MAAERRRMPRGAIPTPPREIRAAKKATAKEMRELAASVGWNLNNTLIEYYQWQKFHGKGRTTAEKSLPAS